MPQYVTESGLLVTDRRHSRSENLPPWPGAGYDDPRAWPPNENVDPPPPDQPGVGPNMSEGFGNTHVMYPAGMPPMQAWSGWPVEWNTPNWGGAVGYANMISRISTVFGAIDLNSGILSTMPPYRIIDDEVTTPLGWMKNPQPEVYTGWCETMRQLVVAFYDGEAFLWATSRYADGTVRTFVVLNNEWVFPEMDGQTRRYFLGDPDRGGFEITEDCLHIPYMSWPGRPRGMGPLEALATNLFGVAAMERYQSNLAVRGGIPWGVLTAPGNLSPDQAQGMRDNFVQARMSAMGAPAVLSGGVSLTPFTVSPRDMALLELRQFDEARISTVLGVPPFLMALPSGDNSMTYRNAEGVYDFHWRAYLRPKAAFIAEAISNWALPSTQAIEFNRDDYIKAPFNERVTGYQTLFAIFDPATGKRAITIDEIRAAERLEAWDEDAVPVDDTADAAGGEIVPIQPQPAGLPAAGALSQ